MDHQLIKQIFVGCIIFVTLGCIIYQSMDMCGCFDRYKDSSGDFRNCSCSFRRNRRIEVQQASEIP